MKTSFDIEAIPNGSFALRGYSKPNATDYDGICLIEPRPIDGENVYEICKWIVIHKNTNKNYIPEAITEINKIIKPSMLTGTFEKRKYKIYKRYFAKYNISIPILRKFSKNYNGTLMDFYYVQLKVNK